MRPARPPALHKRLRLEAHRPREGDASAACHDRDTTC